MLYNHFLQHIGNIFIIKEFKLKEITNLCKEKQSKRNVFSLINFSQLSIMQLRLEQ